LPEGTIVGPDVVEVPGRFRKGCDAPPWPKENPVLGEEGPEGPEELRELFSRIFWNMLDIALLGVKA
jgi:hypothetical protein